MAETPVVFDDAEAYERFMGRWSRSIGSVFLDWLAPPRGARWLDVGCGTGVFAELVLNTCAPAAVTAIDPAPAQIEHARTQPVAKRAEFQVEDARSLPFSDGTFEVVASALVINFIPDRAKALAEMRRVTRTGGVVAGYVWDFAAERGSAWPLALAMRQNGIEPPRVPGFQDTSLEALGGLFEQAGFTEIAARPIDVSNAFDDFDDYWRSQTSHFTPPGKLIAAMSEHERERLIEAVREILPSKPDGRIAYSARANAIKARVPA